MPVDHGAPEPLYQQLAEILRDQIRGGLMPPRSRVPSVSRLMAEHEVGEITVRHAVRLLKEEGLVVTVNGRGTFVAGERR
jgi:DNA-binding GntR family transcriptional regulator